MNIQTNLNNITQDPKWKTQTQPFELKKGAFGIVSFEVLEAAIEGRRIFVALACNTSSVKMTYTF
jgi:hypothetical protein